MKNISFSMTQEQIRARTKTVTRRIGWKGLKPGDRLQAVVKSQGLKRGESPEKLAVLEVVSARQERLDEITAEDCVREGFPSLEPTEFVVMFCNHMMHRPEWPITRIEFRYV